MSSDPDNRLQKLRTEADTLAYFLEQYSTDAQLLLNDPEQRLVYFVDAHDLRSYFDPQHLNEEREGFIFDFERGHSHSDAALDLKLRHEQVMWRLLYGGDHVGILPYHGEEIDDEITNHYENWLKLRRGVPLFEQAHQQLQSLIRNQKFNRELLGLQHGVSDPQIRRGVFHRLQAKVPALLAILHPPPKSPIQRIDTLAEKGRVVASQEFPWEKFGVAPGVAGELRELRPSPALMSDWRSYLSDTRGSASNRGNRIDGSALAHLQALNERLAAVAPTINVRLVTRAVRLINAGRDIATLRKYISAGAKLRPAQFLRHPRLLVQPSGSNPRSEVDGQAGGQRPEAALAVAVRTYRDQLAEAPPDNLAQPIQSLLEAWEKFEKSHLTTDLRLSDDVPQEGLRPEEEHTLQRLLSWFRSDDNIVVLVIEELMNTVSRFQRDTFNMGQKQGTATEAYLMHLDAPARTRIVPSVTGTVGPLDLSARQDTSRTPVILETLKPRLGGNAPEEYLGRALLLAAQGQPRLASVYAVSAEQLAKLIGPDLALREARFLLAQLARINGVSALEAASDWIDSAARWLDTSEPSNDPRVHWERAKQILEWMLTSEKARRRGPTFADGLAAVRTALKLPSEGDVLLPLRVLALALTYYLAAARQGLGGQEQISVAEARGWHGELHRLLETLRGDDKIDLRVISRFAQAMELIGFQCLQQDSGASASMAVPMQIPAHLRPRAPRLLNDLTVGARSPPLGVIAVLAEELGAIVRRLRYKLQRDLIYAPIWIDDLPAKVTRCIDNRRARRAATDSYRRLERIAGSTVEYGVYPNDRLELEAIRDGFAEALRLTGEAASLDTDAKMAMFTVQLEHHYVELLLTKVELEPKRQQCGLEALAVRYRELCGRFPHAWMPQFRLHVVLSELRPPKQEEADAALQRAIELCLSGDDTWLNYGKKHWIHRTMRRRLALIYIREADEILRNAARTGSLPVEMDDLPVVERKRYLDLIVHAFEIVYDKGTGADTSLPQEHDALYYLEAKRTWNNVAFSASHIQRLDGSDRLLIERGFDRSLLDKLLSKLIGAKLEDVREPLIIHTIGHASHTLGDRTRAHEAFLHLFAVVRDAGEEISGERVGDLLTDAVSWKIDVDSPSAVGPASRQAG